jgi:hypothetical protein
MFPDYPDNKMKWNNRSPNDTQAALYKCCNDDADHYGSNSTSNPHSSKRSFEVCATSLHYTPVTILVVNETTGEMYGASAGGFSYEHTIYKNSAKGLDLSYNYDNILPEDAKTNISVTVARRLDNNTCTVWVKTTPTSPTSEDGAYMGGVACNSCSWCAVYGLGQDWSLFSADCTNLEHGRVVDCEPADAVYFPLTEAALHD